MADVVKDLVPPMDVEPKMEEALGSSHKAADRVAGEYSPEVTNVAKGVVPPMDVKQKMEEALGSSHKAADAQRFTHRKFYVRKRTIPTMRKQLTDRLLKNSSAAAHSACRNVDAGTTGAANIDVHSHAAAEVCRDPNDPDANDTEPTNVNSSRDDAEKADDFVNAATASGNTEINDFSEFVNAVVSSAMKFDNDPKCMEEYGKQVSEKEDDVESEEDDVDDVESEEDDVDLQLVSTISKPSVGLVEEVFGGSKKAGAKHLRAGKSKKAKGKKPYAMRTRKVAASQDLDVETIDASLYEVVKFGRTKLSDSLLKKKRVWTDKCEVGQKRMKESDKLHELIDVEAPPTDEDSATLKSTCQLEKFVEIIESLVPSQIRAIKEIGFGGLLKFKIRAVPKDLVKYLIQRFNSSSLVQLVGCERYTVDKNDVYDMFQLPISDLPVVEVCHKGLPKGSIAADDSIRASWYEKYGKKKGVITVKDLFNVIPGLVADDQMNEFKRVFVMFSVSCFLAPAARNNADMQIVSSLQNVDLISSYDWCGFVMKRFCASVQRVKNSEIFNSVNACLIIPLLAYFYRFPAPGAVDSVELPLHQHWDTKKVKKRCDLAVRGGYDGFLRGTRHFPLTVDGVLVNTAAGPSSSTSTKRRIIKLEIPAGALNDEAIEQIARCPMDVATMKFKRLLSIASDRFVDDLVRISEPQPKVAEEVIMVPPTPHPMGSTIALIDAMVKDVLQEKAKKDQLPSFDLPRLTNS